MANCCFFNVSAGGLFEGGLFDEAPMGDAHVPDVSSIGDHSQPNAGAVAASIHDDSDEDMGDHFGGGPPSPMGGMRYEVFYLFFTNLPGWKYQGILLFLTETLILYFVYF